MQSKLFLIALVLVGGVVATANAEIVANYTITPTINGTDADWAGGLYTADALLDNKTLNTMYGSADWNYIRMGNDASNLYIYVHYNNAGTATINPGGSSARSSVIYLDTDQNAATGYSVDGIGADVEITKVYYQSTSNYIGYATWTGTAWGSTTNLAWSTSGAAKSVESGSSYNINFEMAIPLSGLGLTATPVFDWVADARSTVSSGGTYNFDVYPGASFNTYGVPEPGTFALLAAGLAGMCAYAWRKRK